MFNGGSRETQSKTAWDREPGTVIYSEVKI